MTAPPRTIAWYPLTESRWPSRHWIGCDTWIHDTRIFARISHSGCTIERPILMLHGLVVSGSYFQPLARYLEHRFRIFIPDLAGFGRSSTDRVYSLEQTADLLDQWMAIHELDETVVVANSLGCQIATLLAVRYPHRVSRLVMVAPTMDPETNGPIGLVLRGVKDIPRERVGIWRIWIPDFLAFGPIRALKLLFQALSDPQLQRLPHVVQPLLGIAGEHDPICPVPWVHRYVDLAHNGDTVVIPAGSHAMNYSSPDELARIIVDLMDSTQGSC